MMNHKLLVFIVAVPIFTILTVDWYQSRDFDTTEDLRPKQRDVALQKLHCLWDLTTLFDAFNKLPEVPEAEFCHLCKNVTEIHNCFSKANFNKHFDRSTVYGFIEHHYNCKLPTFTIAYHSCQLTFNEAVHTQECHKAALSHYSGSPVETKCRETCCPDSSKCGADDIPDNTMLCKNPVFNQTLKENGCLKACLARFLTRYGKQHCRSGAVHVFKVNEAEFEKKYFTGEQCFMKCPDEDEL